MKKSILILIVLLFSGIASAQNKKKITEDIPLNIGFTNKLNSDVLGEIRTLNIYLPDGYAQDSKAYPVIYLLDGSANEDFVHIVGIVQFLTMIEAMPKSIVVGIANVDRKRDFTYPTTIEQDKKDFPTTGSSAKFISFIEKDLQPFIEKKYRTNNSKTIIGQSLGGLLATEVLLKNPNLFNAYVIVSPSLWWDNESLLTQFSNDKPQITQDTKIWISVGSEGKVMEGDAKKLSELLQNRTLKNLKLTFAPLSEETHLTILHNSVYKALMGLNKK